MKPFDRDETERLLTTTKAVRRRLDLTRPVGREVIVDCIRLAAYAPNASNGQEWKWIVVDDPDLRRRCGEQYRRLTVPPVTRMLESKLAEGDEAGARISRSIIYLAEHMGEVPALVFPCYDVGAADGRYRRLLHRADDDGAMTSAMYASIYPAVWSFQLALRSRGLGSVLTTAHQGDQAAMADILGIPGTWDQTCMIPVAYTTGDDFRPSPRRPVAETVIWNRGAP
jgi:nitroreductase